MKHDATTFKEITMNMSTNHQTAFDKLKKMGVPVFERSDQPERFLISAESEGSYLWLDYHNNRKEWRDWSINDDIQDVIEPLGLFAEWENPGCVIVYE